MSLNTASAFSGRPAMPYAATMVSWVTPSRLAMRENSCSAMSSWPALPAAEMAVLYMTVLGEMLSARARLITLIASDHLPARSYASISAPHTTSFTSGACELLPLLPAWCALPMGANPGEATGWLLNREKEEGFEPRRLGGAGAAGAAAGACCCCTCRSRFSPLSCAGLDQVDVVSEAVAEAEEREADEEARLLAMLLSPLALPVAGPETLVLMPLTGAQVLAAGRLFMLGLELPLRLLNPGVEGTVDRGDTPPDTAATAAAATSGAAAPTASCLCSSAAAAAACWSAACCATSAAAATAASRCWAAACWAAATAGGWLTLPALTCDSRCENTASASCHCPCSPSDLSRAE
mmetsp:Transcript_2119/g.5366  ORF Transcript_2119/g.5366 Transcript_2119/m.5366 type:complete len:351 (+) Transcript_2119:2121-3173(+)